MPDRQAIAYNEPRPMEVTNLIKRCFYFLFLILLTISFAGCVVNNDPQSTTADSTLATTEPAAQDPLLTFQDIMPNAVIHDVVRCDLDANNEEDCIVLFSTDDITKPVTAGISACMNDAPHTYVDLGGESGFVFQSQASFVYNNGIPTISVQLKDPNTGTVYLYQVECSYDSSAKHVNYKINSQILSGEAIS